MLDTDPNPQWLGARPGTARTRDCGAIGIPGNQGISAGWSDTYNLHLGGQYSVLDGGDGQPEASPQATTTFPPITVNPPFVAQARASRARTSRPAQDSATSFRSRTSSTTSARSRLRFLIIPAEVAWGQRRARLT